MPDGPESSSPPLDDSLENPESAMPTPDDDAREETVAQTAAGVGETAVEETVEIDGRSTKDDAAETEKADGDSRLIDYLTGIGSPNELIVATMGILASDRKSLVEIYLKAVGAEGAKENITADSEKITKTVLEIFGFKEATIDNILKINRGESLEGKKAIDPDSDPKKESKQPVIGRFNEQGEYELLADADELAAEIGVPADIIRAAAKRHIPPERLMQAKYNPLTAQELRDEGIDWGTELPAASTRAEEDVEGIPPPPPAQDIEKLPPQELSEYIRQLDDYFDRMRQRAEEAVRSDPDSTKSPMFYAEDPILFLEAQGIRKKIEIELILANQIAEDPWALKKRLKRPGELPAQLHRLPYIGYKIGHIILARRIYKKERKQRKEEGTGRNHENGMLGFGLPKTRKILDHIKQHDNNVKVQRNKLRPTNSYQYKGSERKSARRDLAETIYQTLQQQEAFDRHSLRPLDAYQHDDFKKALEVHTARRAERHRHR